MPGRSSTYGCLTSTALGICLMANARAELTNPIPRAARLINPELVRVEHRIDWLEKRLASISESQPHQLKTSIGHRGSRESPNAPPPSVTLDLGMSYPIDMIYLVPAQGDFANDPGIAPQKITLECSDTEDFTKPVLIYRTGETPEAFRESTPMAYPAHSTARFVRLTVDQGVQRGPVEVFALSEFAVFSGSKPVSFDATVSSVGGLLVDGIWHPEALTDGRTPLGIWQNGKKKPPSTGDAIFTPSPAIATSWSISLHQSTSIDYLILFPYEINRALGTFVFPESIRITLMINGVASADTIWNNPIQGSTHLTPLVIPLHRKPADRIIVRAAQPWTMGDQMIHALSEIQVWSDGANLANGQPFLREHNFTTESVRSLSDGFSSIQPIIPVETWLQQLCDRRSFEDELRHLLPIRRSLEVQSELHASWGVAVIVGISLLTPLFIMERRRLMSKRHLDLLRRRIASDLHDDIGSNLGSISLIARTARKDLLRLQGPESIADDLAEMESIARESSLAMRDIVWLLERKQDSIGDLFQRMRETANRLLREIEFTLECESGKTSERLSLDAKRHLFLFYKEAIHNVLKHSQATRVTIRIWDEADKLAIEIADNGIGIQGNPETSTSHVAKLEDRARLLGGHIDITSSSSGTRVRFIVKRSLLHAKPGTT